jgi:hypothetical protein
VTRAAIAIKKNAALHQEILMHRTTNGHLLDGHTAPAFGIGASSDASGLDRAMTGG